MRHLSITPSLPKGSSHSGHLLPEIYFINVYTHTKDILHRDIYYKDSSLFGKQTVVDRYVDDLAYTFEVQRSALNVVGLPGEIISG